MSDSSNDRDGAAGDRPGLFATESVSATDASGGYEPAGYQPDGGGFTETTQQSWFQRLGGALTGMVIGLLCVPGAGVLLFWNEGRAVQTARSLGEGAGLVLSVPAERPLAANAGRLVHVTGPLTIATPPQDSELGVAAPAGTLRLVRRVEMYQWREETHSESRTRVGGGQETVTTYRYNRVWQENRIESSNFRQPGGHTNPQPRYTGGSWVGQGVTLGGFRLDAAQAGMVAAGEAFAPPSDPGGTRYIGTNPNFPMVGDLRITWRLARPETLSVIAAQTGEGFAPYATRAGDRLLMVEPGQVSAAEMFRGAEADNVVLTWVLRLVGVVVMLVGFLSLFRLLVILTSVIPPLGWLVGFGTTLLACVLTLLLAPTIIGVAWLFFRPLIGIAILAAGLAAAWGLSRLRRRPRGAVAQGA